MSYRRMMYVTLLLLLLSLAGCAAFSSTGGGSPEDIKKAEMSKDDLWNQTKALEKEKAAYQKQLADQQVELARMAQDLSDQQTEIARANRQVAELNKSLEESNTQLQHLQDSRQKERPLKEIELVQPKKPAAKPDKKSRRPKSEVRKKSPEAQAPKSTDTSAMLKEITDAKQKVIAEKGKAETPQKKKEADMPRDKIPETKQQAQPGATEAKPRDPRTLDDLSLRMKLFEETEQRESAAKETGPTQVKKGAVKEEKTVKAPAQLVRKEPAEAQPPRQKALKIKVLTGDGNVASARSLSKKLGKMGYRVNLIDKAPRSDFDGTVVYHGKDHRAAAETMAKRLGGGTATRPLTWSSAFDIIVVTGGQRQP